MPSRESWLTPFFGPKVTDDKPQAAHITVEHHLGECVCMTKKSNQESLPELVCSVTDSNMF